MPKKTRQEKILARLRRLEREQNTNDDSPTASETKETPKISFEVSSSSNSIQNQPTKTATFDYSYVYRDLIKSLIFAALAIFFQVVLALFVFK